MASSKKQVQQLARQFFKLSVTDGVVSPERLTAVLQHIENHPPAHVIAVLKAYHRLVATELARSRAVVEYAGSVRAGTLETIAAALTKKYGRAITAIGRKNDALLAGLRVRIGDDTYESSVANQLATLAASV